jgi:raffinose/stachyose/melibiose transport system permease protein
MTVLVFGYFEACAPVPLDSRVGTFQSDYRQEIRQDCQATMKQTHEKRFLILVFVIPTLVIFTVFVMNPVSQTLYRSLFRWDGLTRPVFEGLRNYRSLFSDPDFYISLKNSAIFAVIITTYQIGLGTVFALTLSNEKRSHRKTFKSVFFIPVVLSTTIVCQLWLTIFNGQFGSLNKLFALLRLTYRQDWLSDGRHGIYVMSFVNAWQFMGYHLVILYAAIKTIPREYTEAATIDGASGFAKHRYITLPLLSEAYKVCFVFAITGGLKAFDQIYIMSGGGPGTSTYTFTLLMYRSAFRLNEFGYACSIATLLVIQCAVATILINLLVARKRVIY